MNPKIPFTPTGAESQHTLLLQGQHHHFKAIFKIIINKNNKVLGMDSPSQHGNAARSLRAGSWGEWMPIIFSQRVKWKEHPSPSAPSGAQPSPHLLGTGGCRGRCPQPLLAVPSPAALGWRCSEDAGFKAKRSSWAEGNLPQRCAQGRSGSGLSPIIADKCFRVVMATKKPG